MSMDTRKFSTFLSLILRHEPSALGIKLDEHGWTDVEILLRLLSLKFGESITKQDLDHVVETNNKKRFAYNEDQTKIRASQGHSIKVDLGLEAKQPPDVLYHGTAASFIDSIRSKGICAGERQQVHLSSDVSTAWKVGARHGKPAVITLNTKRMYECGVKFYLSENGVWLTDWVSPDFIVHVEYVMGY